MSGKGLAVRGGSALVPTGGGGLVRAGGHQEWGLTPPRGSGGRSASRGGDGLLTSLFIAAYSAGVSLVQACAPRGRQTGEESEATEKPARHRRAAGQASQLTTVKANERGARRLEPTVRQSPRTARRVGAHRPERVAASRAPLAIEAARPPVSAWTGRQQRARQGASR